MLIGNTFDDPPREEKADIKFWRYYLRCHIDQIVCRIIDDSNGDLKCIVCKLNDHIFSSEYNLSVHLHFHSESTVNYFIKTYLKKLRY